MHQRNSNFQLTHFLAGKCHTPDGAYKLLCQLLEERELALATAQAGALKTQAKIAKAQFKVKLFRFIPWVKLQAEAELLEIQAYAKQSQDCVEAAQREREHICKLIEAIQPHRRYSDLPDYEAHEACQEDEWEAELIYRVENHLLTTGFIPPDEFNHMRLHPSFKTTIAPRILEVQTQIGLGTLTLSNVAYANPIRAVDTAFAPRQLEEPKPWLECNTELGNGEFTFESRLLPAVSEDDPEAAKLRTNSVCVLEHVTWGSK